jgi:hypothetical protein
LWWTVRYVPIYRTIFHIYQYLIHHLLFPLLLTQAHISERQQFICWRCHQWGHLASWIKYPPCYFVINLTSLIVSGNFPTFGKSATATIKPIYLASQVLSPPAPPPASHACLSHPQLIVPRYTPLLSLTCTPIAPNSPNELDPTSLTQ